VLSKRLKELRLKSKKTQKEIAIYLDITREAYTQYETGARNPDYETLKKLADYFGVTVDYLLGRDEQSAKMQNEKEYNVTLTEKDIKEVKKKAEAIKDGLMASISLAFDGNPEEDEETLAKVMQALEEGMMLAKKEAKEKFTPKKYRKNQQ